MIFRLILALIALVVPHTAVAQAEDKAQALPRVAAGTIVDLGVLQSRYADPRRVVVWLPSSYRPGGREHAVLYMHDGQNLFDAATSFSGEWKVDETLEIASWAGMEAIVVGIPNMGEERTDEYSPFVDRKRGGGAGDNYLQFIVETLKPHIDRLFRTLPEREHTGIMGSSMGGLISLYAFFRYGHVFGMAGVMSPSIWFADRAVVDYVCDAPFVSGKLYVDVGTGEGAKTVEDVWRLLQCLHDKGYQLGKDLLFVEEMGADHSERAWMRRLYPAFAFMLGETEAIGAVEEIARAVEVW